MPPVARIEWEPPLKGRLFDKIEWELPLKTEKLMWVIQKLVFVKSPNPCPGPSLIYSEMWVMKKTTGWLLTCLGGGLPKGDMSPFLPFFFFGGFPKRESWSWKIFLFSIYEKPPQNFWPHGPLRSSEWQNKKIGPKPIPILFSILKFSETDTDTIQKNTEHQYESMR